MIRCMNVDEARGVCKDRSRWLSVVSVWLSAYLYGKKAWVYVYVCILTSNLLLLWNPNSINEVDQDSTWISATLSHVWPLPLTYNVICGFGHPRHVLALTNLLYVAHRCCHLSLKKLACLFNYYYWETTMFLVCKIMFHGKADYCYDVPTQNIVMMDLFTTVSTGVIEVLQIRTFKTCFIKRCEIVRTLTVNIIYSQNTSWAKSLGDKKAH